MRQKLIEIIKYGFWGVVSTSVNLLLFAFLDYLDIMHYLVANGIAYAVAVVINYICNKLFVFTAPDQTVKGKTETAVQFVKFIIMRAVSLGIDSLLFYIVVDKLGFPKLPGRIILSMIIIMATFVVSKVFVFRNKNSDKTD